MLAIDRLLNEIDDAPSKERAALLYALIENQEAIVTEEVEQYRIRCEKLYWSAARIALAASRVDILPEDLDALKRAVAEAKSDFDEE